VQIGVAFICNVWNSANWCSIYM